MGAVKVNNEDVWQEYVETNKVRGFSIEGYFSDRMETKDKIKEDIKSDMEKEAAELLSKIENIVKGEKVELNISTDVKKIISDAVDSEQGYDEPFSFVVKAEQSFVKYEAEAESVLKRLVSVKSEAEAAIDALGINRNTYGLLDDLDKYETILKESVKKAQKNIQTLKNIS